MNCELLALIGKLQSFEDWAIEKGGVPPVYTKAAKEATIRLVAMDTRLGRVERQLKEIIDGRSDSTGNT